MIIRLSLVILMGYLIGLASGCGEHQFHNSQGNATLIPKEACVVKVGQDYEMREAVEYCIRVGHTLQYLHNE